MKLIGLVTITTGTNYGNRLQNFAVQSVLAKLGFVVETLHNNENIHSFTSYKNFIRKVITFNKYRWYFERRRHFEIFNNSFINMSKIHIQNNHIPKAISKYDYFICGSDQIWNPMFQENGFVNFLGFAPLGKRIAYAPSFGVEHIPKERKNEFKRYLSNMSHLSVREESGVKIIKALTDRNAVVLIDPTMMLTKEEWLQISVSTHIERQGKYLLSYFLGMMTDEYRLKIEKLAAEYDLTIINLMDTKSGLYSTGPSQFIDLVKNATFVCTDSFHGIIFSIIMKVPFWAFKRKDTYVSMESRITTLLKMFRLESRADINLSSDDLMHVNYDNVEEILSYERSKTISYLIHSLNIDDIRYEG